MSDKVKFSVGFAEYEMDREELEKYKVRKTGYERNHGDTYVYIDSTGDTRIGDDYGTVDYEYATERYDIGNYYSDEDLARANSRADTLLRHIRRWQAENDNEPDFTDTTTPKWQIGYNVDDNEVFCSATQEIKFFGGIYFTSYEAAKKVATKFKEELKWYFSEYRARRHD